MPTAPAKCDICRKRPMAARCSGCFAIGYCSVACQRASWSTHQQNCALMATLMGRIASGRPAGPGERLFEAPCEVCGLVTTRVCGRCCVAFYCGVVCQVRAACDRTVCSRQGKRQHRCGHPACLLASALVCSALTTGSTGGTASRAAVSTLRWQQPSVALHLPSRLRCVHSTQRRFSLRRRNAQAQPEAWRQCPEA